MKILTARQLREIDRLTTDKYGISQLTLMEQAGTCVMDVIEDGYEELKSLSIVILCGKGNNGGDGFVVARLLLLKGCAPSVFIVGSEQDIGGDAAVNLERLKQAGCSPQCIASADTIPDAELASADIIVDAMIGTGLSRPVEGIYRAVIEALSETDASIVSIDVPSGLSADRVEIIGPAVEADVTVTFTALKSCLVFPPANSHAGDVIVADIGNPGELINAPEHRLNLITAEDFPSALHRRSEATHKGDYGRVLVVGGSRGKSGAAAMAGQAALRSGAGLVTVATPASVAAIVAASMPELMTELLPETESGTIANVAISDLFSGKTVVAIGPGLGTHPQTQHFVRVAIRDSLIPVVIDADGLNAVAFHAEDLRGDPYRPVVITPHPGEMSRLIGRDTDYVNANRIAVAREFAVNHYVYVVLKGFRTVVAAPDATVFINATGNPGMATGGTGDILTGMIAGILAQQHLGTVIERLCLAVHLHGLAGDKAAEALGEESLIATDLLRYIGEAWEQARE